MDLDAVHEMNSFGDQMMMPPVHNIIEESMPYEAAFSYDELFPSLPENEVKPEAPAVNIGQWTQKMKVKSTVITQMFSVPLEERRFRDVNNQRFGEQGEQAKICADIMNDTGAHIEVSSSKDQSLTILVTGKEDAVLKARRLIVQELQTQASISIPIPKEHHRFLLGKGGKKLTDLELSTATKISVPRPDDNSDLIKIIGTKEGIDRARHEIQVISDEQGKLAFERLHIPKIFHPFIVGPRSETVNQIARETGARINIPPQTVMKNELTIAGEKEAVAQAKTRIMAIYKEREENCQVVSVEVPKNQHKYIIGPRGQTIQEILAETGVSVEMPAPDVQSDTITLRGEQEQLGPALTLVYSKATSVKTVHLDVPSWLHKYIIGKKGANIKNLTQDLTKVQVDFSDDVIKVEGPREEINLACEKLKEAINGLKQQIAYEEVKIDPSFHPHIIGKSGSNINKLKDETKALINIPSDGNSDIVRIEGPPEGVAQVKRTLMEMVHKMENETSKDLKIEQRFHRSIIGAKGEKIREIRDKFNQVNISFPETGLKSDRVSIRGPKEDVEACYKYLHKFNEELKLTSYTAEVTIPKHNHRFIIGKGGANIKKIRDETNTRIDLPAEEAESNIITIRGRKEDVLLAKEKILQIQEGMENFIVQEIMIPAKLHNTIIGTNGRLIRSITDECGGVTIKFPNAGSNSDKVSIRGVKDDVLKAKKLLIEYSNEKQLTGFTDNLSVEPEQLKFLIGRKGINIKRVRDNTGARIVFPDENDEDRNIITIIGRKEQVAEAKKELDVMIAELKNVAETFTEIDPKHHRHFVAKRAEVLQQIKDDFGGVTISFPRNGSNGSRVVLKGQKDYLEAAKQRLHEIVADLESQVTIECVIPQEHHRTILGSKGFNVQRIQREFNVSIKLPDREKEDPDRVTMNGDYHSDEGDDNRRNIIVIKGKLENCEAAQKELEALVPVVGEIEIPYDLHRFIIGQKGRDVRQLMNQYNVNITIPRAEEHSETILIKGSSDNVERAKADLQGKMVQLEQEKQDRILRSFRLTVEVDPQYHPKLIGRSGAVINKIRKDHDVMINFPERDQVDDRVITIIGYEQNAEAAKEAILKFVQEQEDMYKEEVMLDSAIHSRIIGGKGRTVRNIMDRYKVDIRFPKPTDPEPDLVVVYGAEDNVQDAIDHLRLLEEEFLQDVREKDMMRQYTHAPSRNGTHDSDHHRNEAGFVVKGAPWDRKGEVPDTTNTQEFPSFGSGAQEMPSKQVVWGPSRR